MSPEYTVFYFDFPGKAEVIRLILHASGQEFKDERIAQENWLGDYKNKMPINLVPVLQIDDEMLFETCAIVRYLGKAHNLDGQTPIDAARCDAVICLVDECFQEFVKAAKSPDHERKTQMEAFRNEKVSKLVAILEKIAKKYGKNGYFVTDKLTVADLYVYGCFYNFQLMGCMEVDDSIITKNRELVETVPSLKEYLSKRRSIEEWRVQIKAFMAKAAEAKKDE